MEGSDSIEGPASRFGSDVVTGVRASDVVAASRPSLAVGTSDASELLSGGRRHHWESSTSGSGTR
ncbi:hypothetical protein D8M35_00510 [Curtobacterium sp. HSID17257]|nr:hypothetical protein D8M35_00510 [Curtobacterium sp. HSID17257]